MSTAVPASLTAICPHCGKRSQTHAANSGRRARCGRCKEMFRVPSLDDPEALRDTMDHGLSPAEPVDEIVVGFDCGVCQTRMTVPARHVGRRVKCPDCGTATEVPAPEAPRAPDIPSAIFGDQYDVFEGEQQPWGAELAAQQPKWIAVVCGHCQTLMHAREEHVGKKLKCPDCGVATRIEPPEAQEGPYDVLVDGYDVAPPEVEEVAAEVNRVYLEQAEREAREEAEKARAEHPELPAAPLLTGVLPMVVDGAMVGRAVVVAVWLIIAAAMLGFAGNSLGAVSGGGQIGARGYAILAVCVALMGSLIAMLALAYCSAVAMAIVTESSEGADKLHDPPSTNPIDWMGESFTMAVAVAAAVAPGGVVGIAIGPAVAAFAALASLVLCFPLVLLSQLDLGSPFALVSPRLIAELRRVPGSWLLLMVQSLALLAAFVAVAAAASNLGVAGLVVPPALVAAGLVYFRLVGRFAWVVAEKTSE